MFSSDNFSLSPERSGWITCKLLMKSLLRFGLYILMKIITLFCNFQSDFRQSFVWENDLGFSLTFWDIVSNFFFKLSPYYIIFFSVWFSPTFHNKLRSDVFVVGFGPQPIVVIVNSPIIKPKISVWLLVSEFEGTWLKFLDCQNF